MSSKRGEERKRKRAGGRERGRKEVERRKKKSGQREQRFVEPHF